MAREFAKKFYNSQKWKDCREEIFNKYFGICAECGKPGGRSPSYRILNSIKYK